jgi:predicted GNAT family acetyltransferase
MNVVHNPGAHRFEAVVEGHLCRLDYRLHEHDGEVMFTYTFVVPRLRGQAIAAELVRVGLEWAREQNLKVVPACSYVRVYMKRHRQTQDLLADENP